jgi:glycosyltransferase involved in cell wall biosynthesis
MYEPSNINNVYAASNKIFEAMLAGVPVITNRETVMSEIVKKENCGPVVPYYDDAALEQAIMKLKMDERFRRRLANNGKIASKKYCWESSKPRFLAKYGRLTSDSSGD